MVTKKGTHKSGSWKGYQPFGSRAPGAPWGSGAPSHTSILSNARRCCWQQQPLKAPQALPKFSTNCKPALQTTQHHPHPRGNRPSGPCSQSSLHDTSDHPSKSSASLMTAAKPAVSISLNRSHSSLILVQLEVGDVLQQVATCRVGGCLGHQPTTQQAQPVDRQVQQV